MNIFSLVGKITVNYADAVNNIDKVSKSAENTAKSLEEVDKKADEAGDSVEDAGKSAKEADSGFSTWKATLANLASTAITKVVSGCTQLASKITDVTKTAVGHYAEYEQLVGGVETLYKDSSDKLIEYAEGAYKTAGMSSNEYMSTATSFAASLIQGLGGDTEKAVELTNLAITDMSDNANKMGTDMGSIQDAYQGFAKQNYTMLDNLKLGYGGTQEEMIRLINDSGILNEKIESLDGITFDQMIQAIHKIQDNLGITGTTAIEAGTTISGSWGSVQALFENILTKIGAELAPTVMDFLKQLSAWMESVDWDAFANEVGEALQGIFDWIEQIDFTKFFEAGINGVKGFLEKLGDLIEKVPKIIQTFKEWSPFIVGIVTAFEALKLAMGISSLISGISTAWTAFKTASEGAAVAQGALNVAMNANSIVLVVTLVAGLVAALITLWATNEDFRNAVTSIWEKIKEVISTSIDAIKGFFGGLAEKVKAIPEAFATAKEAVANKLGEIGENIRNSKVGQAAEEAFGAVRDTVQTVMSAAHETVKEKLGNIKTAYEENGGGIKGIVSAGWEAVKGYYSSGLTFIDNLSGGKLSEIKSKFSEKTSEIKTKVSEGWENMKTTVTTKMSEWKTNATNKLEEIKTGFSEKVSAIKTRWSSDFSAIKDKATSLMETAKTNVATKLDQMKASYNEKGGGIKGIVSATFTGIKDTINSVMTAANSLTGGKLDNIKDAFTSKLGAAKSTVSSVLDGIKSAFSSKLESARSIVASAIEKIKSVFKFEWSLPKLKVPHISISGSFSLDPPSVPHFSIEWYKKAMGDGMIMNQPTIFGYNAKSNRFMAGGEAGSETVVGTQSLMDMIKMAVKENDTAMLDLLNQILAILTRFMPVIPELANLKLVTDTGVLAGELAPSMDVELGKILRRKERG